MGETCDFFWWAFLRRLNLASKWPDRLKRDDDYDELGNDAIDATVAQFSKVESWLAFFD